MFRASSQSDLHNKFKLTGSSAMGFTAFSNLTHNSNSYQELQGRRSLTSDNLRSRRGLTSQVASRSIYRNKPI